MASTNEVHEAATARLYAERDTPLAERVSAALAEKGRLGDALFASTDSCGHGVITLRFATSSGGQCNYRAQCLVCGQPTTAFLKTQPWFKHYATPFDDTLRDLFWEEARTAHVERNPKRDEAAAQAGVNYESYLQSEQWRAIRDRVVTRAAGLCEGCGTARGVDVHHTTYAHLGYEFLFELLLLCRECHRRWHATKNWQAARHEDR